MNPIQHLYWRAGFGLHPEEWAQKKDWSINQAVDDLFNQAAKAQPLTINNTTPKDPRSLDEAAKKQLRRQERKMVAAHGANWILRMADPSQSALIERMSLFWHGHFACATKVSKLAINQLNSIRAHAIGSFKDLLLAMSKDVSMIRFLNNQQNKKKSPNENFARELMELFTLGRGNYTENDIKEAARAFTGWSSNFQGDFVFRSFQHDYGQKTFFGKQGNWNGEDIIDMILEKREAAEFITRKIYKYFVNENVDEAIVQVLAQNFYDSGYNIGQLMRSIFESKWFYDDKNVGNKIKSPVELAAGILRTFSVSFDNDMGLVFIQKALGQSLFNPPNVAGWAGGQSWIDNATLMVRLNLVAYLMNMEAVNYRPKDDLKAQQRNKAVKKLSATVDLSAIHQLCKQQSYQQIFEVLNDYLLVRSPKVGAGFFSNFTSSANKEIYTKSLVQRLMTLPEYQLC